MDATLPRQVCMYLCVKDLKYSTTKTGRCFNRDHSTVVHAVRKVETLMTSAEFAAAVDEIRQEIREGRNVR